MLSLLISIAALGFIVAFHELGHFMAAKAFHVGVKEFALGFGPRLLSGRMGETDISLRLIPFGGACVMAGEDGAEDGCPAQKLFSLKPAWQRFVIVAAGPVFNFILAFLLALIITSRMGYDRSTILAVDPDYPLSEAGVEAGDVITGLNGSSIETARDIGLFMLKYSADIDSGAPVTVSYLDASDSFTPKSALVSARYDEELSSWRLGFSYSYAYLPSESVTDTLHFAFYDVKYCIRSALLSLKLIVSGEVGTEDVMGPVGIVAVMDETVDAAGAYGVTAALMSLIEFMILISGSLGLMNLLPIPALDGGRLLFIAVELFTGHAVPPRLEGMVHMAGFALLFALMVLVMFRDALRLITG